jgi:hypothetical protein
MVSFGWKLIAVANTLAYYHTATVMGVKTFKIQVSSLIFVGKARTCRMETLTGLQSNGNLLAKLLGRSVWQWQTL